MSAHLRYSYGVVNLKAASQCPRPSKSLMRGYPESLIKTADNEEFWVDAKKLLNVTPADKIANSTYYELQKQIDKDLEAGVAAQPTKIPTAEESEPGPLAVGKPNPAAMIRFNKFSTPGPLLALQEHQRHLYKNNKGNPLMIATNVVAKRLFVDEDDDHKVTVLETSRGDLCFLKKETNVLLAAGAIPNTTLLLNSLPSVQTRAGSRLTGHFLSHIAARFPLDPELKKRLRPNGLEIAASYVAGRDKPTGATDGLQYHIQVTALHSPNPELDAEDAARECPDYAAAATKEQLTGSENYIVLGKYGLIY